MAVKTRLELPLLMLLGMGFATFFAAIATIVLPFALLGLVPISVGEREVTGAVEWFGYILMFLVVAGLMGAVAYGFRQERLWARPLVPFFWGAMTVYGAVSALVQDGPERAEMAELVAQGLLFGLFALWYFYGKRSVVEYYRALARKQMTSDAPLHAGA